MGVGVSGARGDVRGDRVQGRLDRVRAVAEDVDRTRAELDAANALGDQGDAQTGIGGLDRGGQAGQSSANNNDVSHRTTSSLAAGKCSTSSVPS